MVHRVIIVSLVGAASVSTCLGVDSRWFRLIADRNDDGGGGGALLDVLYDIESPSKYRCLVVAVSLQWHACGTRADIVQQELCNN